MADQYLREYSLIVAPPTGEGVEIKGLRIVFEITKSLLSFPNLARIDLYNLNDQTLAKLQQKYTKIILNAGYKNNVRLLFKGEIRNVFQGRSKNENVVTIYAGDGQRDFENSVFSKTFSENITVKKIFQEVARSFEGVTFNGESFQAVPTVKNRLRGQVADGKTADILDQIADEFGFNWSIQDGELITTPIAEALQPDQAVLISSRTGMIGSPTVTEIGADVTTLLNPLLLPNRAFKIESAGAEIALSNTQFRNVSRTNAEGLYKVQEVTFKGDSRQGQWVSMAKGITLR